MYFPSPFFSLQDLPKIFIGFTISGLFHLCWSLIGWKNGFAIFVSIVGGIYVLCKTGLIFKIPPFRKYARWTSMLPVGMKLIQTITKSDTSDTVFAVNDTHESASLTYSRHGTRYLVNIPYVRVPFSKFIGIKFYLHRGDDIPEIDITQQIGIPYMISARQLGGCKIIARKEFTVIKEWGEDIIPDITKDL